MGIKSYPSVYFELMFVGFTLVMGMSLSSSFLAIFANDLDPTGVMVGFVVSAWFFSRIFTELPSGVLSDRLGRRKLLVGGLGLSALGALICSTADYIYLLIIGRSLWGLGTALFFMCSTALIMDLFKSNVRGRAMGTFQSVEFIGSFIGAPIGGFISGIIGYRGVFFLAFLLIAVSFSIAFISRGLRKIGAKTSSGEKFSVKKVFFSLGNWSLAIICVNSFSRMLVMQGVTGTVFPLYLNHQLGISVELIGVIISLRTIGHIIAAATSGYLSDKFGRKPMILIGMLMQSICLYLYTFVSSFELLLVVSSFEGFGIGTTFTSLIVLLSEVAPSHLRGGAIGMYRTFMDIGGFLGPPFFMLIFSGIGPYSAFLSAIVIYTLNMALIVTIKSKRTAG